MKKLFGIMFAGYVALLNAVAYAQQGMTQEMADPGVMTKFALKIIPFLFVFGIAIGWPVANIVF